MPIIRKWEARLDHRGQAIVVTMECPYFNELLFGTTPDGKLPPDLEAHALWDYYGCALTQYERAKANMVEESELSEVFDMERARAIFRGTMNKHGIAGSAAVKYWGHVERQRKALGARNSLPDEFMFRYWGN